MHISPNKEINKIKDLDEKNVYSLLYYTHQDYLYTQAIKTQS